MKKQLRPYQKIDKQNIYSEWAKGHRNILYVLPTGLGKTVGFCDITIDHIKKHNVEPTAIVVHRKELVQQISLTLADEEIPHNIIAPRNVILQIITAHRKVHRRSFYDPKAHATVVSVDTLNARPDKYRAWAKGIKLWVTDEAHHLLKNNKWGKAVSLFVNAKGLGVTATPRRLDGKGLGSHVDGVFDVMVEGPDVAWGIENKFLSRWKAVIPPADLELHLKTPKNRDYNHKELEEAASKSHIVGDVVDHYIKWSLGKQAILFAPTIGVGNDMENEFISKGIPAKLLTGTTPAPERLQGILDFQDGKIQVLLNVDLFDEGFNVPAISTVILARPTMSLGKYKQMVGRGLRILEGKTHALIIDHVGNIRKHGRPDKKQKWSLDRVSKKKKTNQMLRFCTNPECLQAYERELKECPYCSEPAIKGGSGGGERVPPQMVDGDLVLLDPDTLQELEKATILEDPESVGARVAHVAGTPAGIRAMKNQQERIDTQEKLKHKIAEWAGAQSWRGLEDREIHKLFFLTFNMTIMDALALKKVEMESLIVRLDDERE